MGLEEVQERMHRYTDPVRKEPLAYQVGDLIGKKFENSKGAPIAPVAPVSIGNSGMRRSYILLL